MVSAMGDRLCSEPLIAKEWPYPVCAELMGILEGEGSYGEQMWEAWAVRKTKITKYRAGVERLFSDKMLTLKA